MVPCEVLADSRLSAGTVRVYAIISYYRQGSHASIGQRKLAEVAGMDRRSLRKHLKTLSEAGHLVFNTDRRERSIYKLTSDLFNKPVALTSKEEPVRKWAGSKPPIGNLMRCPRCSQQVKQILKNGSCRRCNNDDRHDARTMKLIEMKMREITPASS